MNSIPGVADVVLAVKLGTEVTIVVGVTVREIALPVTIIVGIIKILPVIVVVAVALIELFTDMVGITQI